MHHQTAGTVLVPVPAPKVVCAVHRVEQPLKVDRLDIANLAPGNELLDLPVRGVVAVVEQDLARAVGALDGVENLAALFDVPCMCQLR